MAKLNAAALRRLKAKRQKEKEQKEQLPEKHIAQDSEVEEHELIVAPLFLDGDEEKLVANSADFAKILAKYGLHQDQPAVDNMDGNEAIEPEDTEAAEDEAKALSKKRLRKMHRMTVAQLKQAVRTPEVVEWEDTTARDPLFLVFLKGERLSVPVPRHWSQKRKYLAGKRGFVKPPFELPSFIRDTGILEQREAVRKEDATKSLKVRARERMHPKLGRISVDYERLYDAFYKFQTRPPLTPHGALYYEGWEFEGRMRDRRPGHLSDELRQALGMIHLAPPPWLHNQQRWGPPPSYPGLRIPGFNSPIPEGAQWGFHPLGWGKPPADLASLLSPSEQNRLDPQVIAMLKPVERNIWGEFEPELDEEGEEGEEDGDKEDKLEKGVREVSLDPEQLEQFAGTRQVAAPDDESVAAFVDSPSVIEIHKRR